MAISNPTGVDVSHFQGAVDWSALKAGGQSFVSIKATEGTQYSAASYYTDNVAAARAAGLMVGGYHFFSGSKDGKAQADYFLSVAKPQKGDLLPMLDLESAAGDCTTAQIVDGAHAWMETVKAAVGANPFIYTTASFFAQIGNPSGFEDYPLWVAHYGVSKPTLPQGWTLYTIWQHSQTGRTGGINGDVDMDSFNGPMSTLEKFCV